MRVLIADDESIVLEGLQYIINWDKLGFSIISLAKNGEETLEKILNFHPDLVLLDIRMPKLTGIEIIQSAREQGFTGHFIILSGISDFSYAQIAMKYGVDFYLTKPIDEEELEQAVIRVKGFIEEYYKKELTFHEYRENARDTIIRNIITGKLKDFHHLNLKDFYLSLDQYQVVIYERYHQTDPFVNSWDFAELLRLSNENHNSFDHIQIDKRDVILLKGELAVERFLRILSHYRINPQKGSPLESLFLAYGRCVYRPEDIYLSYQDASHLLKRRFFCQPNQYVLGYDSLPDSEKCRPFITEHTADSYASTFANFIQTKNIRGVEETLTKLRIQLFFSTEEVDVLKHFLMDIYLQIKHMITRTYPTIEIPFSTNSAIIDLIETK